MVIPTWDQLQKNQTDSETIESAISRLIEDHNNDPTAHLEVGQSLQSHKASAIIDHLAESIVSDKIRQFTIDYTHFTGSKFLLFSHFETIDGFSLSGDGSEQCTIKICAGRLTTGSLLNNWAILKVNPSYNTGATPDYTKNPIFQLRAKCTQLATSNYYFGIGDSYSPPISINCTYFSILGGVLYAVTRGSTNNIVSVNVTGSIDLTAWHTYRIEVLSGSAVNFYVDEVLVLSQPFYLTNGSMLDLVDISEKNLHNGSPSTILLEHLFYQQDM